MEYLLFRLYGPLASWGEIAVGESRHSANYPSKSALLGLVAAALGITRDDEAMQNRLHQDYALAMEVLSTGQLLRDYHTAQVPDSVRSGWVQYFPAANTVAMHWPSSPCELFPTRSSACNISRKNCASRCSISIWAVSPVLWPHRCIRSY